MAGKQYKVIRPFRRTDPRTGADTHYDVGDTYSGAADELYLTDSQGPDGQGPLIAEAAPTSAPSAPTRSPAASTPAASDSSSKEN